MLMKAEGFREGCGDTAVTVVTEPSPPDLGAAAAACGCCAFRRAFHPAAELFVPHPHFLFAAPEGGGVWGLDDEWE